ncbi:MAG TPA: hypothetical protein VL978_00410 [Puia sp.]|nr:hypothetical protein [Puia sp.]
MSDKDFQDLMDLATELAQTKVSKEEARSQLIRIGVLDKNGHWAVPEAAPYLLGIKPISELRRRD